MYKIRKFNSNTVYSNTIFIFYNTHKQLVRRTWLNLNVNEILDFTLCQLTKI